MKTPHYIPLGIHQLTHHPLRLLAGLAGVALMVFLLTAQLAFREALLGGLDELYFSHMFNFSLSLTLLVGAVVLYQVLVLDIRDHREEYAMLRALGYDLRYLQQLPRQQAALLALGGYGVGIGLAQWLLPHWASSSSLELDLSWWKYPAVGLLTAATAWLNTELARRQFRGTDPCEACA